MKGVLIQLVATFLISIVCLLASFGVVWPSYTLRLLQSDQSPVGYKISDSQAGLIGSFVMLGAMVAPFLVGYLTDSIGRKKTAMLCGLSFILGWSIVATAKSVAQILIGRLIIGVGLGMQFIVAIVFVSEIGQTSIRGTLPSILTFMFNVGTLVSYIAGWLCSYKTINYLAVTAAVAMVVMMCWLKETPSYLLGKNMEKEALSSLKFYRGQSTATQEIMVELEYLYSLQTNTNKITDLKISKDEANKKLVQEKVDVEDSFNKEQSIWELLRNSKSSRNALLNLATLMICASFMGMLGVTAYAGPLFAMAAPGLSPDMCAVIVAVVISLSSGISVVITDLVPRRVLMISSCLLSSASMAVLASQLRWSWGPEWSIPLLMVLFCLSYSLGANNVPFVQLGECFPPQVKNVATSAILFCMVLSNFVLLILFPHCVELLGLDVSLFMFAIVGLLTAIMAFLIMRETKRVPFEVIQDMFQQGFLYTNANTYDTMLRK